MSIEQSSTDDQASAFIDAATWHGTLEAAEAILATHPDIATTSIHAAAVLGDDTTVRRFLTLDPANATATASPHGGNALVYLCLSNYLRLDKTRSETFCARQPRCWTPAPMRIPDSGQRVSTPNSRPLSMEPQELRTILR